MGVTDTYGIPWPENTALVRDGAAAMRSIAEATDDHLTVVAAAAESARALAATKLNANAKAVDSDKLDGLDSSAFLLTTGKAADSELLDGLNSTYFYSPANPPPAGAGASAVAFRARNSTSGLVIPNATDTVIPLETEITDTHGFHEPGVHRATIPAGLGGVYVLSGLIHYNGVVPTATTRRRTMLRVNAGTNQAGQVVYTDSLAPGGTGSATGPSWAVSVATVLAMVPGDYVELVAYQESGGNAGCNFYTHMALTRVGIL